MKRKKATFKDIPTYYKFTRISKSKSPFGVGGTFYWLSDNLNEVTKLQLEDKYNNLMFMLSGLEYAPEIHNDVIFVADKVL